MATTMLLRRLLLLALVTLLPAAGAGAAEPVRVADPGDGASWTATASLSKGGRSCTQVRQGRVNKGTFCARLGRSVPFSYNVRYDVPPDRARWRSVFAIVLAPEVVSARLDTPDGVRRYTRGRGPRVLLAVVAERVEQPPLLVRVRTRSCKVVFARAGQDPSAEVLDPFDAPSWRTVAERRSSKRTCVSWLRVAPRFGGPAAPEPTEGPFVCGDPSRDVVGVRAQRVSGRLVVFGLVGPRVRRVGLRQQDGTIGPPVTFDATSRTFLAVLRDDVDPASLSAVFTLASGGTVSRPLG